MSLQVWLPLNGNLNNQGLSDFNQIINTNPAYVDNGKIGKALSLGSISMPADTMQSIFKNNCFSICFWIYINADTGDTAKRAMFFGNNSPRRYSLFQYPTCNDLHWSWANDTTNNISGVYSGAFPSYQWTHCTITYDSITMKIYLNGELKRSANYTYTPINLNYDTRLFENCANNGRYLNDYRIYDHALSVKEVEEISKGLVLHYKLDNNGQGQYNLLKDTNKGNYRWLAPSGNGTGTITSILIDGINCARYEMTVKSTNWCVFAFRPTNNVEVINTLHETNSYTLSFDIFPSQPINNAIPRYVDGNAQNNLINWPSFSAPANAWYHYEGTAISSGATQSNQSFYINYLFDIGTYDFKNLKIEIGTKATGYNVHIEESFLSNIIYDSSGYQHNGDLVGTITNSILTPRYNISTHFINGSYGRIQERPSICLPTDAMTVNLWTRIDTWGNPISCTEGGGWNFENSSGIQFSVYVASVGYKVANSGVTPATLGNTWHMLTGTFDKENVKIYIDGVLKKTTTIGSTNPIGYANNYLFLTAEASGNNTSPASSTFVGDLSDLRIYCTALTEDQIKELYDTSATIDKNGNVYAREVQEI